MHLQAIHFGYLGLVDTMDHEVVPGCCKKVGWLLNLSRDDFRLHQRKDVIVNLKVEVPKRHVF